MRTRFFCFKTAELPPLRLKPVVVFAVFFGFCAALFYASEKESVYSGSYMIMGRGNLTAEDMGAWLTASNPDVDEDFARDFAMLYIKEAALEGVNHDVAFSQMCLETGFLKFNRIVTIDMNNFGGLGAISMEERGERFATIALGVRAQIQHLKAYGSTLPLTQKLVDPRYYYVRYGSAPSIYDLSGKWAVDEAYGEKLKSIIDRAYYMAAKNTSKIISYND
ncbi:MAG: glucosaminidase domain-containing protein [Spirochaetaceae bacterium]|jgi:hypothetical protein|nr:glucosaminidase domain-containing protein [Spirochaetaceae bacterium]